MSIFDTKISVYKSVFDNRGTTIKMIDFLHGDYKSIVDGVRSCDDEAERKRLKSLLPCATISGLFSPTRSTPNLVEHSGAICIDIDKNDNPYIDFATLKTELADIEQVAYISYSVSGNGLFVIIPIAYPHLHKEHFKSIEKDFIQRGIVIDYQCKDVTRLRLASFDDAPYININATPYIWTCREPVVKKQKLAKYVVEDETIIRVEQAVSQCEKLGINLTEDYQHWCDIGFSLASLGECGRDFYHRLSRISTKYNARDCDSKFDNLLHNGRSITIGTFFYHCRLWGVF